MTYTPRTFTKIVDGNLVTEVADTPSEDVEFVFNGWTPQGEAPPRPPSVKDRVEDIEEELEERLSESALSATFGARFQIDVTAGPYNAAGDGTTDDTAAIQAALDAVPTGGGIVFFPAGNYLVTGGLTCDAPVQIVGVGTGGYETDSGGSRILCNSTTATVLTLTAPGSIVVGMTFENTSAVGTQTAGAALNLTDFDWGRIERCMFIGFWHQLLVDGGFFYVVRDCAFMRPVSVGAYLRNGASGEADHGDWTVTGCTFSKFGDPNDGGTGVRWERGGGIRLVNNKMNSLAQPGYPDTGAWHRGFDLELTNGNTSVCVIQGNSIEGMKTGPCIRVAGAAGLNFYGITIGGNELFQLGGTGVACIELDGTGMASLKGVAVHGNFATGGTSLVLKSVSGGSVTGNEFHMNSGYSLNLTKVKGVQFAGNRLTASILDNDHSTWTAGYGHDRRWKYAAEELGNTGTKSYGFVSPAPFSSGILTVKVRGDMSTLGAVNVVQSRIITKGSGLSGPVTVGATVGTDIAAGAGAGDVSLTFDLTTAGAVKPTMTSTGAKNFRGVIEVEYDGLAYLTSIPA